MRYVRAFAAIAATIRQFAADRRGSVAAFVAVGIFALMGAAGLATDAARGYLVKARLSQALDAAALAGGRVMNSPTRDADIMMYFNANFPPGYMGAAASGPTIDVDPEGKVLTLTASATLPTTLMRVLGVETMNVASATEVTIESRNLEVSLVLDITGSMAGQRIIDLRDAADELIDIVVHDIQDPYYSKLALVPYSMGVNVGNAADDIRGPIPDLVNITGATKTNPVVVTAPGHGFTNGQTVYITEVKGMTQLNNKKYTVASATTNTFALSGINGGSYSTYTSSGKVGRVCTSPGCTYFEFTNAASTPAQRTHLKSTCVTERTGPEAYTDAAPSDSYVGRNYPSAASSGNPCVSNTIVPLTSDKALLHGEIEALSEIGSTAGHIGIAWGWYMLSPNFGYLWPAASQPAPYGTEELLKVAIIMTDGEFNTAYCNGVIAKDSGSGSGSANDKINCNATNGSSFSQGQQLCANMKAAGIVVYTVGFALSSTGPAATLMAQCASSPSHLYLPGSGIELKDAFRSIAMSVSRLRLSK